MASPAPTCKKALQDATLKWPDRNRASDGIMGDKAHRARPSDHNAGNAFDLTHDPINGPDCHILSRDVIKDPRVSYVIFYDHIYKTYKPSLGWAKYTGPNKHRQHMHVSIKADARDDLSAWPWSPDGAEPASPRTLKLTLPNLTGADVLALQKALGAHGETLEADGQFGMHTEKSVRRFQAANGLDPDGIVGPATRKALGL